jgi:hippurate hydrolase
MLGAGHCIVALQSLVARNVDPMQAAVVSITMAEAGEAQNQVAARAVLKGTARWMQDETGSAIEQGMRRIARGVAETFGLQAEVEFRQGVQVTANNAAERDLAAAAAQALGPHQLHTTPAMTGEDFSWFLQEVPGAFVWIGNGPTVNERGEGGCELHNPRYDFNDAILPAASGWLAEVAKRSLDG